MPKRKKSSNRRRPILTPKEFVEQHAEHDEYFEGYLASKKGRRHDTAALRQARMQCEAEKLPAANHNARLALMWAALNVFGRDTPNPKDGVFMLTLAPADFAMPMSRALHFDVDELREWAHSQLAGRHYFGMVDIALYTRLPSQRVSRDPIVSWHIHALVWGKTAAEFAHLENSINEQYGALIPGRTAAQFKPVRNVLGRLCYILKAPLSEYRAGFSKKETVDKETGELRRNAYQWKQPLRGINALRAYQLLVGERLSTLLWVNGDGFKLFRRVWSLMKADLRKQARQRKRRFERAFYGREGRPSCNAAIR